MKTSFRYFPAILVIFGSLMLAALTFTNLMYYYYGWTEFALADRTKTTWTQEEVKTAFRSFVAKGWGGILAQAVPVGIILFAGIACFIQSFKNKKPNKSEQATLRKPSD